MFSKTVDTIKQNTNPFKFGYLFEDNICLACLIESFNMSSIPQGAFITMKVRKNMEAKKSYDLSDNNTDRMATKYNSKFMNSIWGMYNRYSVHNLKKNFDTNASF